MPVYNAAESQTLQVHSRAEGWLDMLRHFIAGKIVAMSPLFSFLLNLCGIVLLFCNKLVLSWLLLTCAMSHRMLHELDSPSNGASLKIYAYRLVSFILYINIAVCGVVEPILWFLLFTGRGRTRHLKRHCQFLACVLLLNGLGDIIAWKYTNLPWQLVLCGRVFCLDLKRFTNFL